MQKQLIFIQKLYLQHETNVTITVLYWTGSSDKNIGLVTNSSSGLMFFRTNINFLTNT